MSLKKPFAAFVRRLVEIQVGFADHLVRKRGPRVSSALVETLNPVFPVKTEIGTVSFFCPGDFPLRRAESLLTKEPETIEWLHSFDHGDVLWDVGANVGVYSLYAGLMDKGIKVLAFEPSASNYFVLNRNIELNGLADRVQAFNVALNNSTQAGTLHMSSSDLGRSCHSFDSKLDPYGKPMQASFEQGMVGVTADDFVTVFGAAQPNHLKIDVDGNELLILEGAKQLLANPALKTVQAELDTARDDYMARANAIMAEAGFKPGKTTSIGNDTIANVLYTR